MYKRSISYEHVFIDGLFCVYNYHIKYRPGNDYSNADVLLESPTTVPLPGKTVFLMDTLESTPVNAT